MPKTITPTVRSVLTLLNNINDLIVVSQRKEVAKDVMTALQIYARNKNFHLPEQKIENFYSVLIDSRPLTLHYLILDIAQDIVQNI